MEFWELKQREVWELGESIKAAVLNQGSQRSNVKSSEGSSGMLKDSWCVN